LTYRLCMAKLIRCVTNAAQEYCRRLRILLRLAYVIRFR